MRFCTILSSFDLLNNFHFLRLKVKTPISLRSKVCLLLDTISILNLRFPRVGIVNKLALLLRSPRLFVLLSQQFLVKFPVVLLVNWLVNLIQFLWSILVFPLLLLTFKLFGHSQSFA